MTIEKGRAWGRSVDRPDHLRIAGDDAALAALLTDGSGHPTAASGGDMFATVGARPVADRVELMVLPLDLLRVRIDDRAPILAVAHVVVRNPWWRGGAWFGDVLAVMNAEYCGDNDVAPRGHPNDGRAEALVADSRLGLRQRFAVRSRLRNGTHLPHPAIETRSIRSGSWTFDHPQSVIVDGRSAGRARMVAVEVSPDAAELYV